METEANGHGRHGQIPISKNQHSNYVDLGCAAVVWDFEEGADFAQSQNRSRTLLKIKQEVVS